MHASPGQTKSQVDPSLQLASTCVSVWSGLKTINCNFKILLKFLFLISGVPLDQLEPSVFAKARAGKGRDNAQKQKDIAAIEAQIYHLTEILGVSES